MTIPKTILTSAGFPGGDGPITAMLKKATRDHDLTEPKQVTANRERMTTWKSYIPRDRSAELREAITTAILNDTDPLDDPTVLELERRQGLADANTAKVITQMITQQTEKVYTSLEDEWLDQLTGRFNEYVAALNEPMKAKPLHTTNRLDLIKVDTLKPEDAADVIRVRDLIAKMEDIASIWNRLATRHGVENSWAPGIGVMNYPSSKFAHGQILEGTELESSAIRKGDLFLAAKTGVEFKVKTFAEANEWLQAVLKRRKDERTNFVSNRAKAAQSFAHALAGDIDWK